MKRIKSGIPGLDRVMKGGFPERSVVLVSGEPGTGKTLFGLQYIYSGANNGEPGVYLSFEQESEELTEAIKPLGMDFPKLEKQNKARILRAKNVRDVTEVFEILGEQVKAIKAKRLVIDSLSSIEIFASTFKSMVKDLPPMTLERKFTFLPPSTAVIRRLLYHIIDYLKSLNVTTLLISEAQNNKYSRYGVAEFLSDGIIRLTTHKALDTRKLEIIKMRNTEHTLKPQTIQITKKGLMLV